MEITAKIREKLLALFEGVNYRQIISERVGCHPNTVSNVLLKGHKNYKVALALLNLGKELKEEQSEEKQQALAIAKQL
jgi:hypothetical protein